MIGGMWNHEENPEEPAAMDPENVTIGLLIELIKKYEKIMMEFGQKTNVSVQKKLDALIGKLEAIHPETDDVKKKLNDGKLLLGYMDMTRMIDISIIKMFLALGSEVKIQDDRKRSALMFVMVKPVGRIYNDDFTDSRPELKRIVMNLLIEAGCDIKLKDEHQNDALKLGFIAVNPHQMMSIILNHAEIKEVINDRNKWDYSPIMFCVNMGFLEPQPEFLEQIITAGADIHSLHERIVDPSPHVHSADGT